MKGHDQKIHILVILIAIGGLIGLALNYNKKTEKEKKKDKMTFVVFMILFLAIIAIASFQIYKDY